MGDNQCPSCGGKLPLESINLAEGVALCPGCGQLSRLSDVVSGRRPAVEDFSRPPAGCSVSEWGQYFVLHATLRSVTGFFGMLFITLFWNGIVSVFVLIACAGLYTNLIGPLPAWFPAPEMGDGDMSLGMTLFLCVFLVPFVAVGLLVAGLLVLHAAGKVEVLIGNSEAVVRTGIGFLVWRRRFDPTQIRRVYVSTTSWKTNDKPGHVIVLEGDETIKFGSLLPERRREWLVAVLDALLVKGDTDQRRELLSMAAQSARWP